MFKDIRPKRWNEVIGQDNPLLILKSLYSNPRRLPGGFILYGSYGVGKTTIARLFSRSLTCLNKAWDGCSCDSCTFFKEDIKHPDIVELDAASHSGVDSARELVDSAHLVPNIGARRVILIDESQRLSREAWDVYLKVLEDPNNKTIFIFITNEFHKIPDTIKSRCLNLPIKNIDEDSILGFLTAVCNRESIEYTQEGLKLISRKASGHIRDALMLCETISVVGKIDKDNIAKFFKTSHEFMAMRCLLYTSAGKLKEAIQEIDGLCEDMPTKAVVDKLFQLFAESIYSDLHPETPKEELKYKTGIKEVFKDLKACTSIFLDWSGKEVPKEALSILLLQLNSVSSKKVALIEDEPYKAEKIPEKIERKAILGPIVMADLVELTGGRIKFKNLEEE